MANDPFDGSPTDILFSQTAGASGVAFDVLTKEILQDIKGIGGVVARLAARGFGTATSGGYEFGKDVLLKNKTGEQAIVRAIGREVPGVIVTASGGVGGVGGALLANALYNEYFADTYADAAEDWYFANDVAALQAVTASSEIPVGGLSVVKLADGSPRYYTKDASGETLQIFPPHPAPGSLDLPQIRVGAVADPNPTIAVKFKDSQNNSFDLSLSEDKKIKTASVKALGKDNTSSASALTKSLKEAGYVVNDGAQIHASNETAGVEKTYLSASDSLAAEFKVEGLTSVFLKEELLDAGGISQGFLADNAQSITTSGGVITTFGQLATMVTSRVGSVAQFLSGTVTDAVDNFATPNGSGVENIVANIVTRIINGSEFDEAVTDVTQLVLANSLVVEAFNEILSGNIQGYLEAKTTYANLGSNPNKVVTANPDGSWVVEYTDTTGNRVETALSEELVLGEMRLAGC